MEQRTTVLGAAHGQQEGTGASMAKRTKKGNVTAEARKKHGGKKGKYPIFDHKSCVSAVNLRHNSDDVSAATVLNRAASWARAHNDSG